MIKTVLFVAAAHSGGHITPAAVLAREWKQNNPDGQVVFFTSNRQLDQRICAQYAWIDNTITLPVQHSQLIQPLGLLVTLYHMVVSFFISLKMAWHLSPTKVLTTGGMISIPVCLAAWLCGATVDLYELNAVPGLALRTLLPIANTIFTCFAQTAAHMRLWILSYAHRCQLRTYPVRYPVSDATAPADISVNILLSQNLLQSTGTWRADHKTILVLGGSQGSAELNASVIAACTKDSILRSGINVIHQTGNHTPTLVLEQYKKLGIPACVFDYLSDIRICYWLADLVICRAGAGAIFEALFFGTPTILVPLVTATNNHQMHNAQGIVAQYPDLFTISSNNDSAFLARTIANRLKLT